MSTESTAPVGKSVLSDSLDGSPPFTIHGTALGVGDVTIGKSGIKKRWTPEALEGAAGTLSDSPIVKNHVNDDVDQVVGKVTEAKFRPNVGVVFEGEVDDEDLAKKIGRGWLEVSPRILHQPVEEMSEDDDGAKVVEEIRHFVNLAVVTHGAAPSNDVSDGPADLSATELQAIFDYENEETEGDGSGESLAQHAVHEPEFSSTADQEWNKPSMEDFDTDDLSEIDDHFIVSATGFPPENFGELSLPVVEPDGTLNLNALANAKARAGQVSGLSGNDVERARQIATRLANENFEDADFTSDEESNEAEESEDGESTDLVVEMVELRETREPTVPLIELDD